MKKIILFLSILISFNFAYSNPMTKCTKKYPIEIQKAYVMAYSALKNGKCNILEVQSDNGYILFSSGNREFLLETSPDGANTIIKIIPVDSDMSNLSVQENIFKLLDSEALKVK